jgi:hypothetical protein
MEAFIMLCFVLKGRATHVKHAAYVATCAEASWFRTFTQDDHDLDIIVGGLAWRF